MWDEAIAVAEKHDRINLKNTYHRYAKALELKVSSGSPHER
jgi:hypothetical protein